MVSFLLDVHLVLEFWGYMITFIWASLVAQDGKEYACNAGELSSIHGKIPWRREWLPTPVFLPGQFHGQRSLVGYSPWGRKELDTAERLTCGNLIFNLCVKLSDSFPKWLNHFTLPSGLFCFAILSVFASFVLKVCS